jgi:hypothetical protein
MTQRLLLRKIVDGETSEVEEDTVAVSSGLTTLVFLGGVLGGDEHDINKTMARPMPPQEITEGVRRRERCIVFISKRRVNLKLA